MSIAVCILAKNEEKAIAASLAQISRQSFVRNGAERVDIHVVANGCTDATVDVARSCGGLFDGGQVELHVHDLQQGGKSRAWNRAVHELVAHTSEVFVFIDADIKLTNEDVIAAMLTCLNSHPHLAACSGYPVKDVQAKENKSFLDRFSLMVSDSSRTPSVMNGSLYIARAATLREIWLPDQTPGEDGFLNAMLTTRGFTRPLDATIVTTPASPTHSFQAHGPLEFFIHERRMIVGTLINRWIFEHLWSLRLASPAGPLIREWNETDPGWVERLVYKRAQLKKWLIPNAVLLARFKSSGVWWKRVSYIPIGAAATLLTLPPAILANKRLKEIGAATTW